MLKVLPGFASVNKILIIPYGVRIYTPFGKPPDIGTPYGYTVTICITVFSL